MTWCISAIHYKNWIRESLKSETDDPFTELLLYPWGPLLMFVFPRQKDFLGLGLPFRLFLSQEHTESFGLLWELCLFYLLKSSSYPGVSCLQEGGTLLTALQVKGNWQAWAPSVLAVPVNDCGAPACLAATISN